MGTIHGSGSDMFRHADYSLHLGSWIQPNVTWQASGYRLAYVRQLRRAVFQSPRLWSTPSRPRQPHETPAATGAHAVPSFPRNAPRWPLARRVPARIRWRERALHGGRGRVTGWPPGRCREFRVCISAGAGVFQLPALVLALPCSSHPLALTQRWSHSHRPARRVAKRRTAARSDRVHVRSSGQPWVTNGQMKWTSELMDRSESS